MTRSRGRAKTGFRYLDDPHSGPPGREVVVGFAHRGGATHPELLGLENTLAAFRHAYQLGFDYLETDVHATRDGVLIAFHDDVLDRVTDRRGRIEDLTAAEVRRARIAGREPIPTMTQLLRELPRACFNVDVKSDSAVRPLADLIEAENAHDRVLVGSFSARRMRDFRRLTGHRVPTSASPLEVLAFRLLPSGRLARALTGARVDALQIPHRRGPITVATTGLVRRAHAVGVPVHVWTIDDPQEMRLLVDRGVDGLMTDRTDILRSVLSESGRWKERDERE